MDQELPIEKRCVHSSWKARISGYEEAAKRFRQISDKESQEFEKFNSLVEKFVTDSNVAAQEKGLEAVLAYVENYAYAGKSVKNVMSGIVSKCLISSKPKTKELSTKVILAYVEAECHERIHEELIKGMSLKNPKIVATCIAVYTQALREFGTKVISVSQMIQKIPTLLGDRDKDIRNEAKAVAIEIFKWIGPALKPQLKMLKNLQMVELESAFVKVGDKKTVPTRFLRSKQEKNIAATVNGTSIGKSNGNVRIDTDTCDSVEQIEILTKLPKNFYIEIESQKWQVRKDALDTVYKLASVPKLENGDYENLLKSLKKIVAKDVNVAVVVTACLCIAALARGLSRRFPHAPHLIDVIFKKFKEKKHNVLYALREAADSVFLCTTMEAIQVQVEAALQNRNPNIRAECVSFLYRSFRKCSSVILDKKTMKNYAAVLLKSLKDVDPTVRENTEKALGGLMIIGGEKNVMSLLIDVDRAKLNKIRGYYEAMKISEKALRHNKVKITVPETTRALETLVVPTVQTSLKDTTSKNLMCSTEEKTSGKMGSPTDAGIEENAPVSYVTVQKKPSVSANARKYTVEGITGETLEDGKKVSDHRTIENVKDVPSGNQEADFRAADRNNQESGIFVSSSSGSTTDKEKTCRENNSTNPVFNVDNEIVYVDIRPKITLSLIYVLLHEKWEVRYEGIQELCAILFSYKYIKHTLGDLPLVLSNLMIDPRNEIVSLALLLTERLGKCMGPMCEIYLKTLLSGMLEGMTNPEYWVRNTASDCLYKWETLCGIKEFFNCHIISNSLQRLNPELTSGIWEWLTIKLFSAPVNTIPREEPTRILPHLFTNIAFGSKDLKRTVVKAASEFMKHLGYECMIAAAKDFLCPSAYANVACILDKINLENHEIYPAAQETEYKSADDLKESGERNSSLDERIDKNTEISFLQEPAQQLRRATIFEKYYAPCLKTAVSNLCSTHYGTFTRSCLLVKYVIRHNKERMVFNCDEFINALSLQLGMINDLHKGDNLRVINTFNTCMRLLIQFYQHQKLAKQVSELSIFSLCQRLHVLLIEEETVLVNLVSDYALPVYAMLQIIFETSDHTRSICALIKLLRDSLRWKQSLTELIVRSFDHLIDCLPNWIEDVDIDLILFEINTFLWEYPKNVWLLKQFYPTFRQIKIVLTTLTEKKKHQIYQHFSKIQVIENNDMVDFINLVLDDLKIAEKNAEMRKNGIYRTVHRAKPLSALTISPERVWWW